MVYHKEFSGTGSCHSDVDETNKNKVVHLTNITTIQLKKTTHEMLISLGYMGESFDDVVNRLAKDHKEVDKYINRYISGSKGKCISKVILGHPIIANHKFDINNKCTKCGIQGPIKVNLINDEFVIEPGEV